MKAPHQALICFVVGVVFTATVSMLMAGPPGSMPQVMPAGAMPGSIPNRIRARSFELVDADDSTAARIIALDSQNGIGIALGSSSRTAVSLIQDGDGLTLSVGGAQSIGGNHPYAAMLDLETLKEQVSSEICLTISPTGECVITVNRDGETKQVALE